MAKLPGIKPLKHRITLDNKNDNDDNKGIGRLDKTFSGLTGPDNSILTSHSNDIKEGI